MLVYILKVTKRDNKGITNRGSSSLKVAGYKLTKKGLHQKFP